MKHQEQPSKDLSKQQLKSMETKARIFNAAKRILKKIGYEQLSIKNLSLIHILLSDALDKAEKAAELFAQDEFSEAMNKYSVGKKKRKTLESVSYTHLRGSS